MLYLWPSMCEVDFPPYKCKLGRGRKPYTSQSLLPGIETLQHRMGVGAGREVLVACPSLGDTTALIWGLSEDGALCSWLHLPGVDVHHCELGEGKGGVNCGTDATQCYCSY